MFVCNGAPQGCFADFSYGTVSIHNTVQTEHPNWLDVLVIMYYICYWYTYRQWVHGSIWSKEEAREDNSLVKGRTYSTARRHALIAHPKPV